MTSAAPTRDTAAEPAPAAPASVAWPLRRLFPVICVTGLIVVGMVTTTWWPLILGRTGWAVPHDLWGTMIAANRVLHGQVSGLYAQGTALITLPGGALILMPLVAAVDAAGLSLHVPGPGARPEAWLLAGPYMTAISGIAVFAADAVAEHLAASRRRRAVLAATSAVMLWNVTIRWGHPEDAVAVGLLIYSVLALAKGRTWRSAWLLLTRWTRNGMNNLTSIASRLVACMLPLIAAPIGACGLSQLDLIADAGPDSGADQDGGAGGAASGAQSSTEDGGLASGLSGLEPDRENAAADRPQAR